MFRVFGFYKFKKINFLKKNRDTLRYFFIKNNIRGTLIISKEGLNGTISVKLKNISLINRIVTQFLTKPFKILLLADVFYQ